MAKRYRITTLASVTFLSDTLEWAGAGGTEQWARGQFMDAARAHNKETQDYQVMPDFQGASVAIVDADDPYDDEPPHPFTCVDCGAKGSAYKPNETLCEHCAYERNVVARQAAG